MSKRLVIFPFASIASFIAFSFIAFATCFSILRVNEKDSEVYREILLQADPSLQEATAYQVHQERTKVEKQLLFPKEGKRQEIRVYAARSELILENDGKESNLIEKMEGVIFAIQEECYLEQGVPRQKVRLLEADKARYHYQDELLIARQVAIRYYDLLSHTLPDTFDGLPVKMRGRADQVELARFGNKIEMKAEELVASFERLEDIL